MESLIGSLLSVDCGERLGHFQGQLSSVNSREQTITLNNHVFHNGLPSKVPEVTIKAIDIRDLTILKGNERDGNFQNMSTVIRDSSRVMHPVVDYSVPPPSLTESPIKMRTRSTSTSEARTPKKREARLDKGQQKYWVEQRTEECFGVEVDDIKASEDFDFEKSLTLFDKLPHKNVTRKIDFNDHQSNSMSAQTPDIVRFTEFAATAPRQHYYTESGLPVPCISAVDRVRLLDIAVRCGYEKIKLIEMVGRGAAELTFLLLGGNYRFSEQYLSKPPIVVVLCGPHLVGAMALSCARLLASHGVNVSVYVPPVKQFPGWMDSEMCLYKQTGQLLAHTTTELSSKGVELVIWAMDEHELSSQQRDQPWYKAAFKWIDSLMPKTGLQVLGVDPVSFPPIPLTASLIPMFPSPLEGKVGKLYLCDAGIPPKLFQRLNTGLRYTSPFGAKFLISLYPDNDMS